MWGFRQTRASDDGQSHRRAYGDGQQPAQGEHHYEVWPNLRFEAKDVRYPLSFVSLAIADLPDGIQERCANHPLINGQFHLSSEIVNVPYQRGHDLSVSRCSFRSNGIDDIVSEIGIVFGGRGGRHGGMVVAVVLLFCRISGAQVCENLGWHWGSNWWYAWLLYPSWSSLPFFFFLQWYGN